MTSVYRANRKATDEEIVRLNSVGLSLNTIADQLDCHPSTVTLRLKALNIEPADTRRSFMEDIFLALSPAQQNWLIDQLGPHFSIKTFVKNMLVERFISQPTQTGDSRAQKNAPQDRDQASPVGDSRLVSEGSS